MNRTQGATNREIPVEKTIPYSNHITPGVIMTSSRDLVAVFRISGISYQTADVSALDAWHERVNQLMKTIQSPKLALWTHVVRMKRSVYPGGEFEPGSFAEAANDAYRKRVTNVTMMANDLFLTLVFSQEGDKLSKFLSRFDKLSPADVIAKLDDALEGIEEACRTVEASLADYRPMRLGWYEHNGALFSEPLEFFRYLLDGDHENGRFQRVPVPRLMEGQDRSIAHVLSTSRPIIGRETYELRGMTESRVGAMLAFKEYPPKTAPGFLNILLSLPFEFVLAQSFKFIPKPAALGLLTRQKNKMQQSGDQAESQILEIDLALDALASGKFVMGEHHLSMAVFGDNMAELNGNLALARANLSECGATPVREDWGLEAAVWAQLPGNFKHRSRPAPVTSRNFAGFSSFHNMPLGLAEGNQWGPAVALMQTTNGTPYYFNFHIPPKSRRVVAPGDAPGTEVPPDDRVAGNTLIIGPTGSGKTVLQAFLVAQLEKFKPTVFYYDKDRGMEIFIRACGGNYHTIRNNEPTGFNPFKLDPTPANVSFLRRLAKWLGTSDGYVLTPREEHEVDDAVAAVLGLPLQARRLGRLLDFLDIATDNGVAARIQRWVTGHSLGWVFDNADDSLDPGANRINGFDITELLDNDEVREPVLLYLMHRQEEVIDGRPLVIGFDEFWKILLDKTLPKYIVNKEKTIRKQNGIMILGTQSPSDVINSGIAPTLMEQSQTKIFLGNPDAKESDYIGGFGLSRREYELIRSEIPTLPGRPFLVKQGAQSAVCELNLGGLDDILAVLSGTTTTVDLLTSIRAEVGSDPAAWLPVFQERRRQYV